MFRKSAVLILTLITLLALSCSSKLSEEEYYEKAKEAYSKENYSQAMDYFKKIIEYYPEGKRAAESLFMLGFINANDLKKYDEARKYYQQFIDKYPDHELADDAEYEIKTMGKDLNQLPFLKDLKADSTSK
ncbi:MAG: tetratricopeptide repeat protein [Calditrichaeota bacterium]|nr:tetratricopeptide repeat protein [Calditrichota bacterium]